MMKTILSAAALTVAAQTGFAGTSYVNLAKCEDPKGSSASIGVETNLPEDFAITLEGQMEILASQDGIGKKTIIDFNQYIFESAFVAAGGGAYRFSLSDKKISYLEIYQTESGYTLTFAQDGQYYTVGGCALNEAGLERLDFEGEPK